MRVATTLLACLIIATWSADVRGVVPVAAQDAPAPAARDLAVYEALLRHESLGLTPRRPGLVVTREVGPGPARLDLDSPGLAQNLRRFLRKAAAPTIDAYLRAVRESGELPDALRRVPGVVLLPRSELEGRLERPGHDYWKTFSRLYPRARGIATLSRIGYSPDGQEAMAYLGYSCGLLCGHGLAVVLQELNGQWVPVEHMYLWES